MRLLNHGEGDIAWGFRVAPAKAGAPALVVMGSLLIGHDGGKAKGKRGDRHRLAPRKVAGDLLVTGKAYANEAEVGHRNAVRVSVELGRWRKELAVFGDRVWLPGIAGSSASEPLAFEAVPLDYEHAYGGEGFAWNPVGLGASGAKLPNVEFAERRIERRGDVPGPASFAAVEAAWRPRADRLGTYNNEWLTQYWPGMPADFDPAYWNEAPGDQQFAGGFVGDEVMTVRNMHPERRVFVQRLPGLRGRAFVKLAEGGFSELEMMLDTISVDMEAGQTELVWRGALAVRSGRLKDVEFLFTMLEPAAAGTPVEACARLFDVARRQKYPDATEREADRVARRAAQAAARDEGNKTVLKTLEEAMAEIAAVGAAAVARVEGYEVKPPGNMELGQHGPPAPPAGEADEAMRAEFEKAAAAVDEAVAGAGAAEGEAWTRERVMAGHQAGADFSGADLSALDLSGLDLTGGMFSKAVFVGANLAGTWLRRAELAGADLRGVAAEGANFSAAKLSGAKLGGGVFKGAFFTDAEIGGADFSGLALSGVSFERATGEWVGFGGAKLSRANFRGAVLPRADFVQADVSGALFEGAGLERADFSEAVGRGADFTEAQMGNMRAREADFSKTVFVGAQAGRSMWEDARLAGADFTGAVLSGANFAGAGLKGTRLEKAVCVAACFDEADLQEVMAAGGKFTRAAFERADLRNADFAGANLYRAGFFKTDTRGLKLPGSFIAGTLLAL